VDDWTRIVLFVIGVALWFEVIAPMARFVGRRIREASK
jgi:hypothetical protein